jgi:hypothetical protein
VCFLNFIPTLFRATGQALGICNAQGISVFKNAVIHSNYPVCAALVALGADKSIADTAGISVGIYAHWIMNLRIKALVPLSESDKQVISRIRQQATGDDAAPLFLGSRPASLKPLSTSGFAQRMRISVDGVVLDGNLAPSEVHVWNAKLATFAIVAGGTAVNLK